MVSRASLISRAFGKSGALASVAEASTPASNRKISSAGMGAGASGQSVVASFNDLATLTGMNTGDTVLVTATNKIYVYNGVGWFIIATVTNASPTAITGVDATYALTQDATPTVITAVSTDPEGFALTWSYAVTTGSLGSTATVTQADNVFTITPSSSESDAGTFSITFNVNDGINGSVSTISAFTLAFIPTIDLLVVGGGGSGAMRHGGGGGAGSFAGVGNVGGGGGGVSGSLGGGSDARRPPPLSAMSTPTNNAPPNTARWPWYVAGPLIGLTVPVLLIIGNKSFGISSSMRHVCAACFPADIKFFKYDWKKEVWNFFFVMHQLLLLEY